ncbi:hypothetical protein GIS00_02590 [Nakamurella sp. YIM 132087]|uniref:Uncharacterized protein n=1 Tax=Nakamurella alba TaxID=2665158 RepID=A0A7K1FFE4_9ACTN|nr:hypothetical protein [Nakamurella alba]MTD12832.1 hypothetical protein [Nakamurella alba]
MTHALTGPEPGGLIRRLRARPVSAWQHGDRIPAARAALDDLAAAAAQQECRPVPAVPDLGAHALVDQLEVLFADAARSGVDPALIRRLTDALATRLGVTA